MIFLLANLHFIMMVEDVVKINLKRIFTLKSNINFKCCIMDHVVIIGNGISGITAARFIRKSSDLKNNCNIRRAPLFFSGLL